jgi:hypothetical protein
VADGFSRLLGLVVCKRRHMRVTEQRKTDLRVSVATLMGRSHQRRHSTSMLVQFTHPDERAHRKDLCCHRFPRGAGASLAVDALSFVGTLERKLPTAVRPGERGGRARGQRRRIGILQRLGHRAGDVEQLLHLGFDSTAGYRTMRDLHGQGARHTEWLAGVQRQ